MRYAAALLLLFVSIAAPGDLSSGFPQAAVPRPGVKDLCPVCGMIVSKYTNWTATVVWKDGRADHFDGAKDMFKFLQEVARYAPGRTRGDVRAAFVTSYYSLEKTEAGKALYVIGSDVMGPMGHELVPLATMEEARDFLSEHRGRRILRFEEVTAAVVAGVDRGRF